jgi:hypothetical protein
MSVIELIWFQEKKSKSNKDSLQIKEGYEEAAGISTPSKEVICASDASVTPTGGPSRPQYMPLAQDKVLNLVGIICS